MPRPYIGARAKPSSNSPADPPQKAAPPSPQFTESQQSSPPSSPDRAERRPDSAEWLSLDATEPFPDGLFRVPVPNAVFFKMPELSDSGLRCLLTLIHLSFRFDPAGSEWVRAGDWLTRSDIEDECGLSDQGTRNGLAELESLGWARVDRRGRSHQFQLELEVPNEQFTYVPTALLEDVGDVGSATELRIVLAVLRRTWGWTHRETDPESGQAKTVHDRWAQLSNRELAKATGRSETAVKTTAKALQGEWIERVRPGNGAYQYCFLPEAIGDGSGDPDSFCAGDANDLTPDRQKSDPPSSLKEGKRDKHRGREEQNRLEESPSPNGSRPKERSSAVRDVEPSGPKHPPTESASSAESSQRGSPESQTGASNELPPDFSELPPEKRDLAEKLSNVGLWAGRIAEVLSRFTLERIRANFELYRRRAAEQTIRSPGAWLYAAISDGYALPDADSEGVPGSKSANAGLLPPLEHKQTLSEEKKDAYIAQGVGEDRFHRCPSGRSEPGERRFMYFDPKAGRPTRRI